MKILIGDPNSRVWDDLLHYSLPDDDLPINGPLVIRLVAERKKESDWLKQVWHETPRILGGVVVHLQRHDSREHPFGIQMLLCIIGEHSTPIGHCYGVVAELFEVLAHFTPTSSLMAR